jgi:hypothetical protein
MRNSRVGTHCRIISYIARQVEEKDELWITNPIDFLDLGLPSEQITGW